MEVNDVNCGNQEDVPVDPLLVVDRVGDDDDMGTGDRIPPRGVAGTTPPVCCCCRCCCG